MGRAGAGKDYRHQDTLIIVITIFQINRIPSPPRPGRMRAIDLETIATITGGRATDREAAAEVVGPATGTTVGTGVESGVEILAKAPTAVGARVAAGARAAIRVRVVIITVNIIGSSRGVRLSWRLNEKLCFIMYG